MSSRGNRDRLRRRCSALAALRSSDWAARMSACCTSCALPLATSRSSQPSRSISMKMALQDHSVAAKPEN